MPIGLGVLKKYLASVRFVATLVAAAVILIAVGASVYTYRARSEPSFDDLTDAAGAIEERITVGRLGAFTDHPAKPAKRSGDRRVSAAILRLRAAAATFAEVSRAHGHSRRATAIAYLIAGRSRHAVATIEPALRDRTCGAEEWIVASAAYLQAAQESDDASSFARALAAADRALELSPNSTAARYNRLVALERLGLGPPAILEARRFLAIDGTSAWAVEVRRLRRRLDEPSTGARWKSSKSNLIQAARSGNRKLVETWVAQFPEQSRAAAEAEFTGLWADALLGGDRRTADSWLVASEQVGAALKGINGEEFLAEAIDHVRRTRSPEFLARGYVAYREGRIAYGSRKDNVGAARRFEEARKRFEGEGSPMALVAGYYEAQALLDLHHDEQSARRLVTVMQGLKPGHIALRAQVLWHRQRMRARAGLQHAALKDALEAYSLCKQLGERTLGSKLAFIASTSLMLLGRDDEGWRMRRNAFRDAMASGEASSIDPGLNGTARELVLRAEYDVARSFFDVLLERNPTGRVAADAILWRELCEARVRQRPPNFAATLTAIGRIADPVQKSDASDDLILAAALSKQESDPLAAANELTVVLSSKKHKNELNQLPAMKLERARAYRAAGKTAEAEADLREVTSEMEVRGDRITETLIREAFFGRANTAFDELADLLAERGDLNRAFIVTERGRRLGTGAGRAKRKAHETPADEGITIHLSALPGRLLVTTVDGQRRTTTVSGIPQHVIAEKRDGFLSALAGNNRNAQQRLGRELFAMLFGTIPEAADDTRPLTVVPDKTTAAVPFAALILPSSHHLLENRAITVALPSTAMGSLQLPTFDVRKATVALIADPAFDSALFPALRRLPSAAAESGRLVASLPGAVSVSGSSATRKFLVSALQRYDVVHIAAHATVFERDAALSSLALAPEGEDGGAFYIRDMVDMPVRSRLVVLAGCGTAARAGSSGGLSSFAAAFVHAGVETVIASLWEVDDSIATEVAEHFYARLAAGYRPEDALRQAQIRMMRSPDARTRAPATWAAWGLYKGN